MNLDPTTLILRFSTLVLKADHYIKESNIMSLIAGPSRSPVLGATPCRSTSLNSRENHDPSPDMNHGSRHRTVPGKFNGEKFNTERIADGSIVPALKGRQRVAPAGVTVEKNSDLLISLQNSKAKNSSVIKPEEIDPSKVKKWRPPRLQIPPCTDSVWASLRTLDMNHEALTEVDIDDSCYSVACKKGRRDVMEDSYRAMLDVMGDCKQVYLYNILLHYLIVFSDEFVGKYGFCRYDVLINSVWKAFFGVFDGHGGREAADFAAENLGQNIVDAMANVGRGDGGIEQAVKAGYLATDEAFLKQDVRSGTCCVTAVIRDYDLVVGNVGDCRAILSRDGNAEALTRDHRPERQDERQRIENLGGYVDCHNGIWRVQGLLAVTRGIGDLHMKKWICGEPETRRLHITSDCEFLILASDGLWDKVSIQEAVAVARPFCVDGQRTVGFPHATAVAACRKLVEIAVSRGSRDDVTVMIVDLVHFWQQMTCVGP